ncbi:UNVERIFIED_CONTAM: uncharacterized protein YaiI (UPF0178 family) [Brevibacillus sp. OAP136]
MAEQKRVLVDADACPKQALAIVRTLCERYGWQCITYASYNHQMDHPHHVMVDAGPQAVDLKLTNAVRPGDVVVTQDIGLAAMILGKQGLAVSPHGTIFYPDKIGFMLEERNEKARFRRGGGRTKGPAARTGDDDRKFAESLQLLLSGGER